MSDGKIKHKLKKKVWGVHNVATNQKFLATRFAFSKPYMKETTIRQSECIKE